MLDHLERLVKRYLNARPAQRQLPYFWWDVARRNPGRLTVLLLILVHGAFDEAPSQPHAGTPPGSRANADSSSQQN